MDSAGRQAVAAVASSAKTNDTAVALTGYTDQTGNAEQNLALAKDRANAVHDELVSEGVPESNIVMKAPQFVTGTGSDAQARRVEISPAR